jgi:hypothetical protein
MAVSYYQRANASLVWNGSDVERKFRGEMIRRLRTVIEEAKARVKAKLGVMGKGTPSKPGEPPHADTYALQKSIFGVVDERDARGEVGSPLAAAKWLEFGTSGGKIVQPKEGGVLSWVDPLTGRRVFAKWVVLGRILPRPFLRPTLDEMRVRMLLTFGSLWAEAKP